MTPEEITKLAKSLCATSNPTQDDVWLIEDIIEGILRTHSIVEKSEMEDAEEVTIDGWVAIDEAYDACFLHTSKPHQENQEIADTGDYYTVWESDGETHLLDKGFFPDMDSDSEPLEITITLKPKKI